MIGLFRNKENDETEVQYADLSAKKIKWIACKKINIKDGYGVRYIKNEMNTHIHIFCTSTATPTPTTTVAGNDDDGLLLHYRIALDKILSKEICIRMKTQTDVAIDGLFNESFQYKNNKILSKDVLNIIKEYYLIY